MAAAGRTVDRDRGFAAIKRNLKEMDGAAVVVGWTATKGEHPGARLPMAQLAAIHEFGAPARNIPERSTLRATADAKRTEYRAELRRLAGRAMLGQDSVRGAMESFGARAASDVRRAITDFKDPPNAPATVARKGSSQPLIDTGAMRDAVDHEYRRGKT